MRSRDSFFLGPIRLLVRLGLAAAAATACGGNGDYYAISDIKGQGDTVLLEFVYTCGTIDVTWDGAWVGSFGPARAELAVRHDGSGDCGENPREVPFDVGPMKRAFRMQHPWPAPLELRVGPYKIDQAARCVPNLFRDGPFKARGCK